MLTTTDRNRRIDLLDAVPVDGIEHYGRRLQEHLIGTHDLLAAWGNPDHVCLAGLFHSVYGTKTFRSSALTTDSRNDVRTLIGERAESLVHAFGMSDRKRLLLENRSTPFLWIDHRTGERNEISGVVLNELVEMEVANFVEQLSFRKDKADSVVRDMLNRFESSTERMSAAARDAFRSTISFRFEGSPATTQPLR